MHQIYPHKMMKQVN